jgi:2-iminobutanoate/2-iminopropanoate deaminase
MVTITPYAAPGTFDSPNFAQAIKVTGAQTILFISGQIDWDDQGKPGHPGDFNAQAHEVLRALKAQVEAGGGTMSNLVKLNVYLTDSRYLNDSRYLAEFRAIRQQYLGTKMPAGAIVVVQSLFTPGCLIEAEGIAVL